MRSTSPKKSGPAALALSRSRAGSSTEMHAGCLDEKVSVARELASGPRYHAPRFETVFEGV
jgi:hypothetical protein